MMLGNPCAPKSMVLQWAMTGTSTSPLLLQPCDVTPVKEAANSKRGDDLTPYNVDTKPSGVPHFKEI